MLDILFWSLWAVLAVVIIDPPAWRGRRGTMLKVARVCRCFRCGP